MLEQNNDWCCAYLPYARQLLSLFVEKSRSALGTIFVVYNVHNLLHIVDDVESFKCSLNELSAFPFENHLQMLKRLIRSGQNPLAQVWKRMNEKHESNQLKATTDWIVKPGVKDGVFLYENGNLIIVRDILIDGLLQCDVISEKDKKKILFEAL